MILRLISCCCYAFPCYAMLCYTALQCKMQNANRRFKIHLPKALSPPLHLVVGSSILDPLVPPDHGLAFKSSSSSKPLNPPAPPNPAAAARIQICIPCILRRGNPALGGHFNPRLTTGKLNLRVGQTGADYGGFGERRGKTADWAMTGCDRHCHANRFPTNSHLP